MSIKIIFSNILKKNYIIVLQYNLIYGILFLIIVHIFVNILKVVNFLVIKIICLFFVIENIV